jgi:flagellar basal-body rod protein FlgF
MDKLVYVALSGARSALERQAVTANNLAHLDAQGFRAETSSFRSAALAARSGAANPRVYAYESTSGADFSQGPLTRTGRELDVAVEGPGWLVVRGPDGKEAYTRAGSLTVGPSGVLTTPEGRPVLSTAGPITVVPDRPIVIGDDGTISEVPDPANPAEVRTVGRLKLVDPPAKELVRGGDGLFRLRDGRSAPTSEKVRVAAGAVEGSNVNSAEAMVEMINVARQFELQMKMIQTAEANSRSASQLLSLT